MVSRKRAGALALALVVSLFFAANAAAKDFPVTVSGAAGKVALAKKPVRIVSLSPTATEMLYAIGAGKQVVAVDDQSNHPASAPRTKLSGFTPNVEAIAKYRPDLVVGEAGLLKFAGALRKLGIPVLVQPTATTLANAYEHIRLLGRATGHTPGSKRLVARMKSQIAEIVAGTPRPDETLSVYHEIDSTYYSATTKTFIGKVYALFGLRNIADEADTTGSGYPQLSAEYIVASDPDLIVLADASYGETAKKVADRPGWSTIAAVQDGRIVPVSADIASRWGPRVVGFVRAVATTVRSIVAAK